MLSIWQQVTATALLETKEQEEKKEIPNCHQSNFWCRSDPISALGIKSSDFFIFFPSATWFCSFYFAGEFHQWMQPPFACFVKIPCQRRDACWRHWRKYPPIDGQCRKRLQRPRIEQRRVISTKFNTILYTVRDLNLSTPSYVLKGLP